MNQKLHVNKTDFDSERLRTRTHFETEAKGNSETLDLFRSAEVVFPENFLNVSRVFLEYLHTTEKISIRWNWIFPTFFYNVSKIFPHNEMDVLL